MRIEDFERDIITVDGRAYKKTPIEGLVDKDGDRAYHLTKVGDPHVFEEGVPVGDLYHDFPACMRCNCKLALPEVVSYGDGEGCRSCVEEAITGYTESKEDPYIEAGYHHAIGDYTTYNQILGG